MKMILFFIAGMAVSLLMAWFVLNTVSPVNAEDSSSTSDLTTQLPQLPDIKGIYHSCLTEPFKQVETEIRDPEIANYYHKLMQSTGLTDSRNP